MATKQARTFVIDDNVNDVQLMRRVLERAGYEVASALSGEEGLKVLQESPPDCVLVDYRMPGMNGYEVCRAIKSDPRTESVPVLMLTGADATQNVVQGLDAGADDFVTKSADIDVIVARVRALLRMKSFQDRIVDQSSQLRKLYEEVSEKSEKIMALNQRLNADLQFARRVQEALLPEGTFQGFDVEIRSAYVPSETLSGDFYDYFQVGQRLYIFMADVSGHGLPAAILVSLLKSYLHSEATESSSPADFMARLNDFLFTASLPTQFATAQLMRFEPSTRELVFSNAAHPPFVLFEKTTGSIRIVEQPGHLLGAMPGMRFEEQTISAAPGDLLFMYTDGLTDRRSQAGDYYLIERVAGVIDKHAQEDFASIYHAIYDDVTSFSPTDEFRDDIAFILARF